MKVAVVLFALIVVASASYNNPGEGGVNCFPERCEVCKNHFGAAYADYDCEGQCNLCQLCNAATVPVVEGCRYCKDGIDACIATCKLGQKYCKACASACSL
eukprot:01308.XXX_2926_2518_1 [CDS] Oithona nana genome sequencing.